MEVFVAKITSKSLNITVRKEVTFQFVGTGKLSHASNIISVGAF